MTACRGEFRDGLGQRVRWTVFDDDGGDPADLAGATGRVYVYWDDWVEGGGAMMIAVLKALVDTGLRRETLNGRAPIGCPQGVTRSVRFSGTSGDWRATLRWLRGRSEAT